MTNSLMILIVLAVGLLTNAAAPAAGPATTRPAFAPHAGNPIIPGYYADASVVQADGKVFVYATLDPWGGETLGCWESSDWKDWTYRELNWPTKKACTSPTSKSAKVWAPSVLRGTDGKFHMLVSVGSEVWAGVADSPVGPWADACGGKPMIAGNFKPGFHMIDAELFLDTDGQAYVYWGSGFNWVNGKCWVAKLKPDMASLDGEVHDVTPTNYFEGPFMLKHDGKYCLMWSAGKTTTDTYEVRYGTAASPLGPFEEAKNSPILVSDKANDILSPGHHTMFEKDGQTYILYHRHSVPFVPKFVGRQLCVDELTFAADGRMNNVKPTHSGPAFVKDRQAGRPPISADATFTASSQAGVITGPTCVGDDNYATQWAADKKAKGAWLQMDLGGVKGVTSQRILPEYAWKTYRFAVQASTDGQNWQMLADFTTTPARGSPIVIDAAVQARYLKIVFPDDVNGAEIAIFEWAAY